MSKWKVRGEWPIPSTTPPFTLTNVPKIPSKERYGNKAGSTSRRFAMEARGIEKQVFK
jgi:hypothetical protein